MFMQHRRDSARRRRHDDTNAWHTRVDSIRKAGEKIVSRLRLNLVVGSQQAASTGPNDHDCEEGAAHDCGYVSAIDELEKVRAEERQVDHEESTDDGTGVYG
jgi:hypothetical protein